MMMDPPRKAMHDARDWFGEVSFSLPGHQHPKKSRSSRRANFKNQKSMSIDSQQGMLGSGSGNGSGVNGKPINRKGKFLAASPQTEV